MSVPSVEMGAVVGAHAAPILAKGPYASLGRGKSMPRGSGAPVLTLQGSGEAEIVPDGVQGSGAFDDVTEARARQKPALSLKRFNS
jgi:hypothetical protein